MRCQPRILRGIPTVEETLLFVDERVERGDESAVGVAPTKDPALGVEERGVVAATGGKAGRDLGLAQLSGEARNGGVGNRILECSTDRAAAFVGRDVAQTHVRRHPFSPRREGAQGNRSLSAAQDEVERGARRHVNALEHRLCKHDVGRRAQRH